VVDSATFDLCYLNFCGFMTLVNRVGLLSLSRMVPICYGTLLRWVHKILYVFLYCFQECEILLVEKGTSRIATYMRESHLGVWAEVNEWKKMQQVVINNNI